MINAFFERITVRSIVIIVLVVGVFALAFIDPQFRPVFADLAKVGVGGYFGQMLPSRK